MAALAVTSALLMAPATAAAAAEAAEAAEAAAAAAEGAAAAPENDARASIGLAAVE